MIRDNLPEPRIESNEAEDAPGVPGFRTWRGVYLFVFVVFVLIVIGLTIFTRIFS